METKLHPRIIASDRGREADRILRACVHCGFCNATCPTYQLTGDELDGPRGRIYLMKTALEAGEASSVTRRHLDRCLTCRACETTCPSGVEYGKLLDIGRELVEETAPRGPLEKAERWLLTQLVTRPERLKAALRLGGSVRTVLPRGLANKIPVSQLDLPWPEPRHARRVMLLNGCAQKAATPATNRALAVLLDDLGISVMPAEGCCGAMEWHLSATEDADFRMQENLRHWAAFLPQCEAVISTASGCGVHVKDYGRLLEGSKNAQRLTEKTLDVAEYLQQIEVTLKPVQKPKRIAWHSPCTLQHGQKVRGVVESLLLSVGHQLTGVLDPHLCCGSAGTYSILQPQLAGQLRDQKLQHLCAGAPEVIATANVGCQMHLQSGTQTPVQHWIELLRDP